MGFFASPGQKQPEQLVEQCLGRVELLAYYSRLNIGFVNAFQKSGYYLFLMAFASGRNAVF